MSQKTSRERIPQRQAPDQWWGWVVVATTAFNNGMVLGFDICFPLIFVGLLDKLQASPEQLFWIVALYRGIRSFVSPGASALCNRFGHRNIVIVGGLINTIALVLFAFPISVVYQCFCWGILGACASSMIQVGSVAMNGLYFRKLRARAISIAACGVSIGSIILPILMEFLFDTYGYTGAILLAAAIMFHICPFSFVFRPVAFVSFQQKTEHDCDSDKYDRHEKQFLKNNTTIEQQSDGEDHASSEKMTSGQQLSEQSESKYISTYNSRVHKIHNGCGIFLKSLNKMFRFSILKDVRVLIFCIVLTTFSVAFTVSNSFLAGYANQISLDVKTVSLALAIGSGCSLACRLVTGFIYDFQCIKRRIVLFSFCHCSLSGMTTFLLPVLARDSISFYVLWAMWTASVGPYLGVYPAVLLALVGEEKFTSSLGICRVFEGVGYFAGPIIAGALYEKTGTYATPYYFAGGLALVCTGLAIAYSIWDMWKNNGKADDQKQPSKA